ncbi:hypothetical protein LUZ60_016910 [Juncus effusus]|nr:hypothetical protein LUZ60_016910 [Juncus effusus]
MEDFSSQSLSSSVRSLDSAGALNPYALSSRRRVGPNNRRFPRFFNDATAEYDGGPQHFLDSCFLCKKALAGNRDIFMYRGDMPFCSEECRQTQIEQDETKEKTNSVSLRASSRKELQREEQEKQQNCSPKSQKARAGSILAG